MLHTAVRAGILIASKCQVFQTHDGQLVRGCGLSTSSFLRGKPQIQYVANVCFIFLTFVVLLSRIEEF